MLPFGIVVTLPILVTTPERLAFVVTVAALPVILVWSPVLVPELEPEKFDAEMVPVVTKLPVIVPPEEDR